MKHRIILAVVLAALLPATALRAQEATTAETTAPETGLRAELIAGLDQLERKYLGLADVMRGQYDWRPAEGVRSVGEVFGHVAAGNFMLPSMAGVDAPERYRGDAGRTALRALEGSDEETILAALRHSFSHVRDAIAAIPDSELDAPTTLFGREATNRAVLLLVVNHLHEHLGQAIAYARMNGIAPPWSG